MRNYVLSFSLIFDMTIERKVPSQNLSCRDAFSSDNIGSKIGKHVFEWSVVFKDSFLISWSRRQILPTSQSPTYFLNRKWKKY